MEVFDSPYLSIIVEVLIRTPEVVADVLELLVMSVVVLHWTLVPVELERVVEEYELPALHYTLTSLLLLRHLLEVL